MKHLLLILSLSCTVAQASVYKCTVSHTRDQNFKHENLAEKLLDGTKDKTELEVPIEKNLVAHASFVSGQEYSTLSVSFTDKTSEQAKGANEFKPIVMAASQNSPNISIRLGDSDKRNPFSFYHINCSLVD